MAPTSRTSKGNTDPTPLSKVSQHQHSKSTESQNAGASPSSKSHGSSRTSGSRGGKESKSHHNRRRRSSTLTKSSLRETLSSFGDDVIKVKNWHVELPSGYDNHGYFQPDINYDISESQGKLGKIEDSEVSTAAPYGDVSHTALENNGGVENELVMIMSQHDPNFQTKHFEKVDPNEVGVRSSKWQKLLQASVSSNRFQKLRKQSRKGDSTNNDAGHRLEQFYDDGKIKFDPPFWGVSSPTREKISFLSLSLILHELACFTSCVLLGCMIFQGMEVISWAQQKPFTDNWIFFKWYSSFQTILVVITCLGFLNRVDTTEQRSLWLLPLFLIPVLGLSISDYCNKAWELERLECHNYFHLDELSKKKVHLSQDCSSVTSILNAYANLNSKSQALHYTELDARGVAPLVMRVLAAVSILVISSYLFFCRKSYYLIDTFGPPEFIGNIDLVPFGRKNHSLNLDKRFTGVGEGKDEEMNVIYQRSFRKK